MKPTAKTPMKVTKTSYQRELRTQSSSSSEQSEETNVVAKARDPVLVFCRIRPLPSDGDLSCIRVRNSTTVILATPEQVLGTKQGAQKETQYIFRHVFEPQTSQQDIFSAVAQPLVENLIKGRNSLLFTYGVTGSGKTYTMTGDTRHRGIMPRCLDVLFRTISDYQAKKYVFKPDRLNGFEILSEADALLERQHEMNQRFKGALKRKDSDPEIASQASCDLTPLPGIDEDNMYAVFVTYIEVYNNSVYDLLEEGNIQKTLQSKIIREDANHNMFVHGVTEIEIKSVEEAIEAFQTGQKRKRMGHTVLNAESSRSHSVFNIRLVQAPTDSQGEQVLQDKRTITIGQLSLVDLAGSERSSRTKNTGLRLREAGNINNSLMTLRTCLEYLRENQQQTNAAPKKIPYRDSKVTHLFKNYFDGEGQVSMIVCINPRAEDHDENAQVMKFAEMTQEVQIARAIPIKADLGLTPGRRKANKMFKIAVNNLNELGHSEAKKLDVDIGLVYTLGSDFPQYKIDSPQAESAIQQLMQYLLQRIEKRKVLSSDLETRCDRFRLHLMQMEKENLSLRCELASLKVVYKQERDRSSALENKIRVHESSIDVLNNKVKNRERQIDDLTRQLRGQQTLLDRKEQEKEHQKKKFDSKLAVEMDKRNRLHELKHAKLQDKIRVKDEKLRLLSNIIQSDELPKRLRRSQSLDNLSDASNSKEQRPAIESIQITPARTEIATPRNELYFTPRVGRGMAAANKRHRRSRSTGEKWIEHRAPNPVPLGTVLQPYLKNRKSVTKLTDMKDLTGQRANKYLLVSQEADTDGDVETKLFKGNIIPTCGGGAQVVFDDVECLKQKSPVPSPNRKRPSAGGNGASSNMNTALAALSTINTIDTVELASRCNVGIEGHIVKRTKI
uniref:Kinesin-like protein n=1 Tax=Glossina palpalis gambiensis TaxID=67801 RepID=A0A1B0B7Y8_9MUSC